MKKEQKNAINNKQNNDEGHINWGSVNGYYFGSLEHIRDNFVNQNTNNMQQHENGIFTSSHDGQGIFRVGLFKNGKLSEGVKQRYYYNNFNNSIFVELKGRFDDNEMLTYGKKFFPDRGNYFEGSFYPNGKFKSGTYKDDKITMSGSFDLNNNLISGTKIYNDTGNYFEGSFYPNGKFKFGTYKCDKTTISGLFDSNNKLIRGTKIYNNTGNYFEGSFYPNGNFKSGTYKDDKITMSGSFDLNSKLISGKKIYNDTGRHYEGSFYPNGNIKSGTYKDQKKNTFIGNFRENEDHVISDGKIIFSNGNIHKGTFYPKTGKICSGVKYFNDKNIQKGEFYNGAGPNNKGIKTGICFTPKKTHKNYYYEGRNVNNEEYLKNINNNASYKNNKLFTDENYIPL